MALWFFRYSVSETESVAIIRYMERKVTSCLVEHPLALCWAQLSRNLSFLTLDDQNVQFLKHCLKNLGHYPK
jgi:hypothetical protein